MASLEGSSGAAAPRLEADGLRARPAAGAPAAAGETVADRREGQASRIVSEAIDDLAMRRPSLCNVFSYIAAIVMLGIQGLHTRINDFDIYRRVSSDFPTVGSRLRIRQSLLAYPSAVRASVAVQAAITLAHDELIRKEGLDIAELARHDHTLGDDVIERQFKLEMKILTDFVSLRLARIDGFVVRAASCLMALLCVAAIAIAWAVDIQYLLSTLRDASAEHHGPEDGTSLYRILVYVSIACFAAPPFGVLVSYMALSKLIKECADTMKDISPERAARMLSEEQIARGITHVKDAVKNEYGAVMAVLPEPVAPGEEGSGAGAGAADGAAPSAAAAAPAPSEPLDMHVNPMLKRGDSAAAGVGMGAASAAATAAGSAATIGAGKAGPEVSSTAMASVAGAARGCCSCALKKGRSLGGFIDLSTRSVELVLQLEPEDLAEAWEMLAEDVAYAQELVAENIAHCMTIITQGLAGLATFFVVVGAVSVPLGQRIIITLLFSAAPVWTFILGSHTSAPRSYGVLVLAEAVKHINGVLGIADHMEQRTGRRWSKAHHPLAKSKATGASAAGAAPAAKVSAAGGAKV